MEIREFGRTGLRASRLGLGLAEITRHGELYSDVQTAGRVLNAALDGGVNFLDTAACYGETEEMMGRTISNRRHEYALATKCGHVIEGASGEEWSARVIEESIDRSLKRLGTDYLDVVQLHSCSVEVLEKGEAIEALLRARDAGKVRFLGYSGDNEAAHWAVESGHFDSLQTSYSLVDQHARTKGLLQRARSNGLGVIIKRPVANGVWGIDRSPYQYADEYFRRAKVIRDMGPIEGEPDDPHQTAMGFVLGQFEVDTAIVGTRNPDHMLSNIDMVESSLPISEEVVEELRDRFDEAGDDWIQLG
jgi:aryl-alcohol dehydrogenase-like predicted oxidoreductase